MTTTTDHPLREITIHESILDGAKEVLSKAAGGLELPGFTTSVYSEDEDNWRTVIRVSYDTSFAGEVLWDVEEEFLLDENIFKGIAQGREQDVASFMEAFLPTYRSLIVGSYFDYLIGRSVGRDDMEDGSINHNRFAEDLDWFETYRGPWTRPWELTGASAKSASVDWFELKLRFENPEIPLTYTNSVDQADYDGREITIPISWEDYQGASQAKEGMHALLKRIHGAFVVSGNQATGYFSSHAQDLIDSLEEDDEEGCDEERDEEECPFATGELVFDGDGRVHAARDLD